MVTQFRNTPVLSGEAIARVGLGLKITTSKAVKVSGLTDVLVGVSASTTTATDENLAVVLSGPCEVYMSETIADGEAFAFNASGEGIKFVAADYTDGNTVYVGGTALSGRTGAGPILANVNIAAITIRKP